MYKILHLPSAQYVYHYPNYEGPEKFHIKQLIFNTKQEAVDCIESGLIRLSTDKETYIDVGYQHSRITELGINNLKESGHYVPLYQLEVVEVPDV